MKAIILVEELNSRLRDITLNIIMRFRLSLPVTTMQEIVSPTKRMV